jgi:hypothetical protein
MDLFLIILIIQLTFRFDEYFILFYFVLIYVFNNCIYIHIIGGIASLFQHFIRMFASGTCHTYSNPMIVENCDRGKWNTVNLAMLCSFILLISFSIFDWMKRRRQKNQTKHQNASFSINVKYSSLL